MMKKLFRSRRIKTFLLWILFLIILLCAKIVSIDRVSDDVYNTTVGTTGGVLMVLIGGYGARETALSLKGNFKDEVKQGDNNG